MNKKIITTLLLLWIVFLSVWAQQTNYQLNINGSTYKPAANAAEFISKEAVLLKSSTEGEKDYVVLQFKKLPSQADIRELKEQGIELLNYIQNNAYYASISSGAQLRSGKSKALDNLYSAFSPNELNKINRQLRTKPFPEHIVAEDGKLKLVIMYLLGVTDTQIEKEVLRQLPYSNYSNDFLFHQFQISLNEKDIEKLAKIPWIINISPVDPAYELYDRQENIASGILRYNQDHPQLTGKGVGVGIWDGNVEKHVDLTGRVNQNWMGVETSSHGCHVAGIVAGAGTKDFTAKGAAPGAILQTYNYNSFPAGITSVPQQMLQAYAEKGISITQNSYGYGNTDGVKWSYSNTNVRIDMVANAAPELLHVYAAGNNAAQGAYWSTVTNPSKNTLQVANLAYNSELNPSSSRGPDLTGQIFPHVSAIGTNVWSLDYNDGYQFMTGTSMSCPLVSGFAALIYEKYASLNNNQRPPSSLVKAFICNGAMDINNPGPDYNTGYGEVNLVRSLDMLESNQYTIDSVVNTGDVKEYSIKVPKGTFEVKVMLTWNDPYGTPGLASALINDLDLEVEGNRKYLPLTLDPFHPDHRAVEGVDNLNVVEQVVIQSPKEENIKIRVKASALPKPGQQFSLVYSFVKKEIVLLSPAKGDFFLPNRAHLIKWYSSGLEGDAAVEVSTDGGATYRVLTSVSGNNYISLMTRNEFAKSLRLRVSQGGLFSESVDVSVIGRPDSLNHKLVNGSNQLIWNKAVGATSYEVLRLKTDNYQQYEVIRELSDTSYVVPASYCDQPYWFSVRSKNGETTGMPAVAVQLQTGNAETSLPFIFDFENKINNLNLLNGKNSIVTYRNIPELNDNGVLFFMGNLFYGSQDFVAAWKQVTAATASQAFTINQSNISSASFKLNLPAGKKALLKMKIRIKSSNPYQSFFRVAANDNILPDASGKTQLSSGDLYYTDNGGYSSFYNPRVDPVNYADYFVTKYYDLSAYAGMNDIVIRLDGLCATARYLSGNDPNGSQIYIDDLEVMDQKPYELIVTSMNPQKGSGNALAPSEVKADVVNIGYETAHLGKLKLNVNYIGEKTSQESEVSLPEMNPWTLKNISAGTVSWKTPEAHALNLIAYNAEAGSAAPDTCTVAYIESKDRNIVRMDPQVMIQSYNITSDTTLTDFGSSFYPYPKQNSLRKAVPNDQTKRLAFAFSELDLASGDTISITSGGRLLGKYYGQSIGDTCKSTAYDGELTISLVSKGGTPLEKGWVGRFMLIDKPKGFDLKLTKANFKVNNASWADRVLPVLQISNEGRDTVPLNFKVSYQVEGLPEVIEDAHFKLPEQSDSFSSRLSPGLVAFMTFENAIKDSLLALNKDYNITFKLIEVADEDLTNNTLNTSFFYGNRPEPSDVNAYGFVKEFSLGSYTYQSVDNEPFYIDQTSDTITVEFGKSYPYNVLIDGFYANEMHGVFFIDLNKNGVFEDNEEMIVLPEEDNEYKNTHAGAFVPQAYCTSPGVYGFRVASYDGEDMSAVDFTLKVLGTPISNDVDLSSVVVKDSLSTGVLSDIDLTISRYFPGSDTTSVQLNYSFINSSNVSVYSGSMNVALLKKSTQTRTVKLAPPVTLEGSYKLRFTLVANDNNKDNNSKEVTVYVKKTQGMYSTSINGGIAYSSLMLHPSQASVIPSEYPDFSISNMNDGAWVKHEAVGVNNWFMLSEQYTREWDNRVFYENKLVRIDLDSPKMKYVPLSNSFNAYKIYAIAFDPSSKLLYGLGAKSATQSALYSINYVTGEASFLKDLSVQGKEFSGLVADLHGNLFSVNHTDEQIVKITPSSGAVVNYCNMSDASSGKVNLAYDLNAAKLYLGYERAISGQNVLAEAIPVENRTQLVEDFGIDNQPYCMVMPMLDNIQPAASNIFKLESFNVPGQVTSVVDNELKEVTIFMPETANLTALPADYYFANGNANFYKGENLLPSEGAVLNLSSKVTLKAKGILPNDQVSDWTIQVRNDVISDILLEEFGFLKANNPMLPADVRATVTLSGATCEVPYNVDLSKLIPLFKTNLPKGAETANVLGNVVKSGVDAIDFNTPVLFSFSSGLMNLKHNYKIEVKRQLSPEDSLLTFVLPQYLNSALSVDITAEVTDSLVTLRIPTGVSLENLVPVFTLSNYAKMYLASNGSEIVNGVTPLNLTAPVYVKVVSEDGSATKTYKLAVDIITDIENVVKTKVSVYPNPFADKLSVESEDVIQIITISDMKGQTVYRKQNEGLSKVLISAEKWIRGVYIIQVKTENDIKTFKVVKN